MALPAAWSGETVDADAAAFFESKVRPLLAEKCQQCHGKKKSQAGLRLLSREAILTGGDSGPAAMPGNLGESLLIRAAEYLGELQMPPDGKLSDSEIEVLKQWVQQGLPWPDSPPEPVISTAHGPRWTDEQRGWWSLQPLAVVQPPAGGSGPAANPIDGFLQARLDSAGIKPLPPADKRTLIRRASFDLTGLPPSPEEIEAFVQEQSPDAFARLVERLLDSPHYGERWGRHWLDLVRYADYFEPKPGSHGSAAKFEIFEAWRYRDWVVQAFNRDLPYDQFVVHQIAGDKLTDCGAAVSASPTKAGRPHNNAAPYNDGLIATTVLAIGAWDNGDADKDKVVSDIVDDQINVIGQTFLGLTLACARCHDHKFDPVSTEEYYALAGIFYSSHVLAHVGTKGDHTVLERTPLVPAEYIAKRQEQLNRLAEVNADLAKLQPAGKSETSADAAPAAPAFAENEIASAWLTGQRQEMERQLLPDPPKALAIHDGGTPGSLFTGIQDAPIHIRGSYGRLGPVAKRGLPKILAGEGEFVPTGSGRLELARWIACADNPLTARVMVNRVWQWHFGEGLVRTASNFGKLGERPTHPELLDWLACEFIRSGWSIKSLHRLMMNSAAYQRASSAASEIVSPASSIAADPENRLLARWTPRRLEAECIRDAMLADSGLLDRTLGGPAGDDLLAPRRSLYIATTRWGRAYYSSLFDSADPEQPIAKRNVTTVAPQALFFLNHPFVESQAQKIADTVVTQSTDEASRLERLYARLFGRRPTNDEISIAHELLARRGAAGEQAAWTDLVQVLLASNEFCYVD